MKVYLINLSETKIGGLISSLSDSDFKDKASRSYSLREFEDFFNDGSNDEVLKTSYIRFIIE